MNYRDEDWLEEKYISDDLSQRDIAELCGTSHPTIGYWLDKFGIEKNTSMEGENNPAYGGHSEETKKKISESMQGHEVSPETRRKISESLRGEDNPRWRGGVGRDYGSNWQEMRRKVINRDENCQVCGEDGSEHRLDVHHKEPLRNFDEPENANTMDNLMLVCWPCHVGLEY